jgi:hypothetical protein
MTRVTHGVLHIALGAAAVAPRAASAQPDAAFTPGWTLRIGHSYSSATALRQPATFVVSSDLGRPTLTLLDAGLLLQGPLGRRGGIDVGARYAGGSGRPELRRTFSAITRGWQRFDRVVVAGDAEYETDGGFVDRNLVAGVEATLTHGLRGLGQPWSPALRLRWRPWLGLGYGTVLATDTAGDPEAGAFLRGLARLELHYAAGVIEALGGDRRAAAAEFDLELTGWMLFDAARGEGFAKAALGVPLRHGFSLSASAGMGRQPPAFERERRIGLGLGFRY